MAEEKEETAFDSRALMAVLEHMLEDIAREKGKGGKLTKDDLLDYLKNRRGKLNLFLIKNLPRETVGQMRKDPAFSEKLFGALRGQIVSLHKILLNPIKVRVLTREAEYYPMEEVRSDPELWAARALAALPLELDNRFPVVDLRLLFPEIKKELEKRLPALRSIGSLDTVYGYIVRELGMIPEVETYAERAAEMIEDTLDPGEIVAFYRLLGWRVVSTLREMEPSARKNSVQTALKELTGVQEPTGLELWVKKRAMSRADESMKQAGDLAELFELRFFFSQIGERSNRKLFSQRTGELARKKLNMRGEGYKLLQRLKKGELDEQGLVELVPSVIGKAETFVLGAPKRFLDLLLDFYLDTVCPLLRSLRENPQRAARMIQNYKRQVGLLNVYRDIEHLAEAMQRKMVLAICNPVMLTSHPGVILGYLTRLPAEFYPPEVMEVIKQMVRSRGHGQEFTAGDVLRIFSAYPAVEEEEEALEE